jgi:glycosyltransferase involved in cell wall biosynthesis
MKIGIDLLPLQSDPKRRGISNYTYNLIIELLQLDRNHQFIFFNANDVNVEFIKKHSHDALIIKGKITPKLSENLDLFIFTSFFDFEKKIVDPSSLKCKVAIIVYDIIPIVLWENYVDFFPRKLKYEYFRRIALIRECDKILTISQAVKKDLIEILEIPENSIDVIYAGIDLNNNIPDNESQKFATSKEKYHIKNKYIFSVPSMDIRKNNFGLIEAYGLLSSSIKNEFQLVISNELTADYEKKLRDHARKLKISDDELIFTNYVSDSELALLYKNSSLFVFPSFYEGFGLPVLEAMHYGIPVITSNLSSLPEVVEDAGVLINPYNPEDIANEMTKILINTDLQAELSEKGKVQSEKFSWTYTAQLALNSFEAYNSGRTVRLGMVTTWNVKCGIAEYSKYLIEKIQGLRTIIFGNYDNLLTEEDGLNVIRCWDNQLNQFDVLYKEIIRNKIDVVHFQFNFGLFNLSNLIKLKNKLQKSGKKVIITFHATQDVKIGSEYIKLRNFSKDLRTFDKIIVHTEADRRRLDSIDVNENVVIIPQGMKTIEGYHPLNNGVKKKFKNYPIISTFGFCLPHKGHLESIQAISLLKKEYNDILFLVISALYPIDESRKYLERCQKEVKDLDLTNNVLFFPNFMNEEKIFELLQLSDIAILPYTTTKESSSAAVKTTLAAMIPVIVTDLPIFSEYNEEVYKISQSNPDEIATAIKSLLNDDELYKKYVEKINERIMAENWKAVAKKYQDMVLGLIWNADL